MGPRHTLAVLLLLALAGPSDAPGQTAAKDRPTTAKPAQQPGKAGEKSAKTGKDAKDKPAKTRRPAYPDT